MFRLIFKKNNDSEMLGRTISELQQLRVELSVLKDRLSLIIPGDENIAGDEKAAAFDVEQQWEMVSPGECPDLVAEEMNNSFAEDADIAAELLEIAERPAMEREAETTDLDEGEDGDRDMAEWDLTGAEADGEEEEVGAKVDSINDSGDLPEDKDEVAVTVDGDREAPAPVGDIVHTGETGLCKERAVEKEWAVVNYMELKRPWWALLDIRKVMLRRNS
ncbi:MAG: hypothetical protein ACOY31_00370 [Bacillota bacterium]